MSSIFLAHSSKDKIFARRLAKGLITRGVRVWIDEAEILVGDSLIHKLEQGILEMEYLGVILSSDSVQSEWVQREVEVALNQEIQGKRVKVLPILYRECPVPAFLQGKVWADFSNSRVRPKGLEELARRLLPSVKGTLGLREPWGPKGIRLGLLYGIITENSGQINFSDPFLKALCDSSRERMTTGKNALGDYWYNIDKYLGDLVVDAILRITPKRGRTFPVYEEDVIYLTNEVGNPLNYYVIKIAIDSDIIVPEKLRDISIRQDVMDEMIDMIYRYGYNVGNIAKKEDVRPFMAKTLIEIVKSRLLLHKNERIDHCYLVSMVIFAFVEPMIQFMENYFERSGIPRKT